MFRIVYCKQLKPAKIKKNFDLSAWTFHKCCSHIQVRRMTPCRYPEKSSVLHVQVRVTSCTFPERKEIVSKGQKTCKATQGIDAEPTEPGGKGGSCIPSFLADNLADEYTDVSNKEMLAIYLRHVDDNLINV